MPSSKKKKHIPLFDVTVTPQAKREVTQVLDSGWLSTGAKAKELEQLIAKRMNVAHAVAVNSATAGLQVALMAMDLPKNGEVITTPMTMVASIEAILLAGLQPVLVDIDPVHLTIDPKEVKKRITQKTVAIMPVEMAGYPCDYTSLRSGIKGAKLLSDSAHAFGTLYKGKTTAELADAAVLSFYSTKNLTCGEGGMILTRNAELAKKARLISRHGMTTNAHDRQNGKTWAYDVPHFGVKANLSDIHAAVGLGQLRRFDADQRRRAQLAKRYQHLLADMYEFVTLPTFKMSVTPSWHLYIMQLNLDTLTLSRDQFIRLMAAKGIECGVHYQPVYSFSYYRRKFNWKEKSFPQTAKAAERIVTLPLYPTLTNDQIEYICESVRSILIMNRKRTLRNRA